MLPYFLVYVLLLLCCILGSITKKHYFLVVIFIILTVFSGFRYYVGVDYVNYVKIFEGYDGYSSREIGFSLILDFFHKIGATYQLMFLFMAVVMQYFVYKILKRYNYSVWTSVLIYFCISTFYIATFNGTRQYLAIAVFIWAIQYIERRQVIKYIAAILLAGIFFHESVLLFIPLYFILDKKIRLKGKILALMITLFFSSVLNVIISYTPYIVYLTRERETHISSFTYIFAGVSILLIAFWDKFESFKSKLVMSNMNLLCFLSLLIVLVQSNGILIQMMLRMNSYFLFIYILLVPAVISSVKNKSLRTSMYFSLHLMLLLYFVRTIYFNGEMYDLTPYSMNFNLFK